MNTSRGREECPIVKLTTFTSWDLLFRLAACLLRPAWPRDREQEGTLLKGFDGMRRSAIQCEEAPRTEVERTS